MSDPDNDGGATEFLRPGVANQLGFFGRGIRDITGLGGLGVMKTQGNTGGVIWLPKRQRTTRRGSYIMCKGIPARLGWSGEHVSSGGALRVRGYV